jgi:MFS family permease
MFELRRPWYRELSSYHWFVLAVAALGWLFDTMDQQLFVLVRTPALTELLGADADLTRYGGYATSIFVAGWATGGLIFGLFGDRWGRTRTMVLTILVYSLFTGLSAFSRTWWDFAIYRFLTGMGVGGEWAAGVALVAEVMPARARPHALALLQALSAVGNIAAAGLSFLLPPQSELHGIQGWRYLFLIGTAPALLVVLVRWRLKEPESWVKAKTAVAGDSRTDELHRQLGDLRELFGDRRWRHNTIVGVLMAAAGVMALWGVGFWTTELVRNNVLKDVPRAEQDWYASFAMLIQYVGGFFGVYAFSLVTGLVGRRLAFAISYLASFGAIVLAFGFMTEPEQIKWMVLVLGFCTLLPFGGYAIYFPELFPTRLRATGTGFCYNVARYLAAGAPLMLGTLASLYQSSDPSRAAQKLSDLTLLGSLGSVDSAFRYATLTVSVILLLGLLVLPFAPETKDQPLPE